MIDTHNKQNITDPELQSKILTMNSTMTNQRLGRIPLVAGMPVVFAVNFDVQDGIVNGTVGMVHRIYYYTDENNQRHVTACIVNVPNSANTALPSLTANQAIALQDTTTMNFTHPYSRKHCSIKQTQIPLLPAFALMVHKAQA